MIYEELQLGIKIENIQDYIKSKVQSLPITMQSEYYGGWSVLSANGDYKNGWKIGAYFKEKDGGLVYDKELQEKKGVLEEIYDKKTELYDGPIGPLIDKIANMGFEPYRVRISLLKAGGELKMHRDGLPEQYKVRMHIPIITNPSCFFVCDEGRAHMPANGSAYLVRINRMHQVVNEGEEDRIHIIMDVHDKKGVSRHHRYRDPSKNFLNNLVSFFKTNGN